ncbi:M28 family peptidase, partial [Planctomycetota bacterium]
MTRYCLLTLTLFMFTGCVSIPPESLSPAIEAEELSNHVHFLAQPALRGRKPLTRGSRLARKYIGDRFAACGLQPWGETESYAQSFGIGTNMVGVLPGSDPNIAEEIILVSAHYDHLGKTEDGLCLGASDNAAGVAALLEIAEHLALNKPHPRRSICFAAFDQEENGLLGAFAFSQREDFDKDKIAGVVNIDLLGRKGYQVLDRTLFVAGTHGYAPLRHELISNHPHLSILPVNMRLVGARGDHAAFEDLNACTLFFSSGLYADYHRPGDTPDKIDYPIARDCTKVILNAVE